MADIIIAQQNLMAYSADNVRSWRFGQAFKQILQSLGNQRTAITGFTEVVNAKVATRDDLTYIAGKLNSGGNGMRSITIGIGQTSVGQAVDYVNICYDPAVFKVTGAGQVLRIGNGWQLLPANNTSGVLTLANVQNLTADYKGIGYVVGTIDNVNFLFGLSHNVYTLTFRTALMQSLDVIGQSMLQQYGNNTNIVIGGDFNVAPLDRGNMTALAAEIDGQYVNTTATSPLDYWMWCGTGFQNLVADVATQTRNKLVGLSDHAAALLSFTL